MGISCAVEVRVLPSAGDWCSGRFGASNSIFTGAIWCARYGYRHILDWVNQSGDWAMRCRNDCAVPPSVGFLSVLMGIGGHSFGVPLMNL